ncbi:nuclear transport factor 2 family protein [Actinoallomurus purpureus]|uniref:nuclear transport factor 2 family protein n=1 Tax=Actinoallomurus purpureus TaxID=478114 RepID=UPI0020930B85|nr:nuclear transport factor 2 family protein [Actinoallomurus purpureus]MCO6009708.1 nuclear transport factor 2 family protein [Actinoallomurus purpureus]
MATRDIAEKFFGLLAGGDPDKVAEVFADEIDWYVPGSASLPWTGRRSKRGEVSDYLRTLGSQFVLEKNIDEVEALLVDGDHAVMLGRFSRVVKSNGRAFSMPVAMHLQVAGDKIVKMYLYEDTLKVAEAFSA